MTLSCSGWEDIIYGDRRCNRRYCMALKLRYKVSKAKGPVLEGTGTTKDISSGGLFFSTDEVLPAGATVELNVEWPVLLHGTHRLKLKAVGRVVRSDEKGTAVRTMRHEFHTAAHSPEAVQPALPCEVPPEGFPAWHTLAPVLERN